MRNQFLTKILTILIFHLFFASTVVVIGGAEAAEFKFGAALAMTGMMASQGQNLKLAYDLWAERMNALGGIEVKGKKYPVKIIYYDDKSDPMTTTKLVERLITEDKVDLILGPFSSSCVGPSSTITEKYKVPMLEAAGNAKSLFIRGFKYLFTTLRPAEELADPVMRALSRAKPTPKTIAILSPEAPFQMAAAEGFKAYAEKYGITVIHKETYPWELRDLTPILQKIKAKEPDILAVGSHTPDAINIMKQSKEIDFNPKAYAFSYGTLVPEFIKALGKDADYAIEYNFLSPNAPFKDPIFGTSKDFLDLFERKYGIFPPDVVQIAAVAAGAVFQVAIQNVGATPPLTEEMRIKIRDEMAKIDIVTAMGPVRFDKLGRNEANPLSAYQIQGGKAVCIDPPEWVTGKIVYPAPEWKRRK